MGTVGELLPGRHSAIDAVLCTEQRDEIDLGRLVEDVDDGAATTINTGGVGEQADALTAQRLKAAHGEHLVAKVDARLGGSTTVNQEGKAQPIGHEAHERG